MTARGVWPFAFLYRLQNTLVALLSDVMTTLSVTSTSIVCPVCNTFDIDFKQARAAASRGEAMPCWVCKHRGSPSSFAVAGFASWEHGVPDSEQGSLVDAAVSVAVEEREKRSPMWKGHMKHARDKLIL